MMPALPGAGPQAAEAAPSEGELLPYVRAAAAVLQLPLDDARAGRVALHLARTAEMARLLSRVPLAEADEPAELFQPAPFPADGGTG